MSAVAEDVMHPNPDSGVHPPANPARDRSDADTPVQKFWQWFALVALVLCWIAEATMCAERGF